ncbi:hypothetical protein [Siminovitchia sp. 179-K 8D1 HS]|uniref:hypothetical protein n=1 Tax=Siminovitchia sp. 179-K 8D1 HS TaxID=3142385 RepID=UPI0039A18558
MNVFEAVSKCEEIKDIIAALNLANARLDPHEFSQEKQILAKVEQGYVKELKELEDRMKNTHIKPQVAIR